VLEPQGPQVLILYAVSALYFETDTPGRPAARMRR
jgi:hypothetical protein